MFSFFFLTGVERARQRRANGTARSCILIKEEEKKLEFSYSMSLLFNRTKLHKMSLLDR